VIRLPTGLASCSSPSRAGRAPALQRDRGLAATARCSPPSVSTALPRPTRSCRSRRRPTRTGTCTRSRSARCAASRWRKWSRR
jgi:hypothetical protein